MKTFRRFLLTLLITTLCNIAVADELPTAQLPMNLMPKYGLLPKTALQQEIDQDFIRDIDKSFNGDRKKAAQEIAEWGWNYYQKHDRENAMRRFNQAWMLDAKNGAAIWGMASIQSTTGEFKSAFELYAEAETLVEEEQRIPCQVDHARVMGLVGAMNQDQSLMESALARFSELYQRAPEHTKNLQNWARLLFARGQYAEAWEKIKLAEKTPNASQLTPKFIEQLQSKMPRP